jgi:hypothetical protein
MGLFVHQCIAALEYHVIIELVHYWHSVRDFKFFDVLITDLLDVLEECSESIFVGNHYNIFTVLSLLTDLIVPKWDHAVNSALEGLYCRESVFVNILIFLVV